MKSEMCISDNLLNNIYKTYREELGGPLDVYLFDDKWMFWEDDGFLVIFRHATQAEERLFRLRKPCYEN